MEREHEAIGTPYWSTPERLVSQLQRVWQRGVILSDLVARTGYFPRRLKVRRPSASDVRGRLAEVRAWSQALRDMPHVRVTLREYKHPLLDTASVPHHVWVDSAEDAIDMLGKREQARIFAGMVAATRRRAPALLDWLAKRPLRALRVGGHWGRLLDVAAWLQAHPQPGVYLRQLDVRGVDAKFIDEHSRVLTEMLDVLLPSSSVAAAHAGAAGFARRYGFRDEPERIRLRVLDPRRNILPGGNDQDVTLDAATFAALAPPAAHVFITDSEANFLALPRVRDGLAILADDGGDKALAQADWLSDCRIFFWGDVDTRGFAALDAMRRRLGHLDTPVASLMMDRETFLSFRDRWTAERNPAHADLARLDAAERTLYEDIRAGRYGDAPRLEQERIEYAWVREALGEQAECLED